MTITLRFTDKDVPRPNAKSARGWLRGRHLNVAQCEKQGEIWIFPFSLAEPVIYDKAKPTKPVKKAKTAASFVTPRATVSRMPQHQERKRQFPTRKEEVAAFQQVLAKEREQRTIKYQGVLGTDLQPDDCLVNFVPGHDLTVDYRGTLTIEHKPKYNLPGPTHSYSGFYSAESGGLSSYRVDPETTYDVRRG